jgi:hypothetical protein
VNMSLDFLLAILPLIYLRFYFTPYSLTTAVVAADATKSGQLWEIKPHPAATDFVQIWSFYPSGRLVFASGIVTVLDSSAGLDVGMSDAWKVQRLPAGGFYVIPAEADKNVLTLVKMAMQTTSKEPLSISVNNQSTPVPRSMFTIGAPSPKDETLTQAWQFTRAGNYVQSNAHNVNLLFVTKNIGNNAGPLPLHASPFEPFSLTDGSILHLVRWDLPVMFEF